MTTSKQLILDNFHTEFMSETVLHEGFENQLLLKAIGDFELELYPLNYDNNTEEFNVTLQQNEINALSMLMYKHYLKRELDRILKLNNIVGKDIQLTAMGQTKQVTQKVYDNWLIELDKYLNKLKESSFY